MSPAGKVKDMASAGHLRIAGPVAFAIFLNVTPAQSQTTGVQLRLAQADPPSHRCERSPASIEGLYLAAPPGAAALDDLCRVSEAFFEGGDELENTLKALFEQQCRREDTDEVTDELEATVARIAAGARSTTQGIDPEDMPLRLLELERVLSSLYVECGYISSGALLNEAAFYDQNAAVFEITEGWLKDVRVGGRGRIPEGYVSDRLLYGRERPFNVHDFEDRFRLVLQDPLIDRMNGEIGPGEERGEAVVDVEVTPADPVELGLVVDNHRPPSTGALNGRMEVEFRSLLGLGDIIDVYLGRSAGAAESGAAISVPLHVSGTAFLMGFQRDGALVIEEPSRDLDIESESVSFEVGLSQPLYRTPEHSLTVGLALARENSRTTLLDQPFSFSPGVREGKSDITAARFIQEWVGRSENDVLAASSTLSVGLDLLGSTINSRLPDSRFFAWLGRAQYARRFRLSDEELRSGRIDDPLVDGEDGFCDEGWLRWACRTGVEIVGRGDVQLANDRLLPLEQIAVGGASTVRGYRENELVRDNGLILSAELRLPLWDLNLPVAPGEPEAALLQLATFIDYGRAWNEDEAADEIAGAGVGLIWEPAEWFRAELYWAQKLIDVGVDDGDNLQDHGIYFQIALTPTDDEF